MLRRAAIRTLKQASVVPTTTRAFATKSTSSSGSNSSRRQLAKGATALAIALAATGTTALAIADIAHAREKKPDLEQIKQEIIEVFEGNSYMGPTLVRLAWHSSGTYSKKDGSGGSTGGTIRFAPEINHGGNAGLHLAVKALEKIKKRHPEITYADLYVLAGVTMIEEMGGPTIPFRLGRPDAVSGKECTPDDRLPNADMGSKDKTTQHVRDVFYRMGFTDREIVALIGCHAIGRCHPDRSGYDGPWTNAEWTFSNEFFRVLLEHKWTLRRWKGPQQYEDHTGQLMMLPADMVLIQDPKFRKFVELYAKDEELWFKDFAAAFQKLTENGVKFPDDKPFWRKLWPF